jgi:hypothetical protein
LTTTMEFRVRSLTTSIVRVGTQPIVSLHQRSTAKRVIGMTETCKTSYAAEMHMAGSKIGTKSESALSRNNMMSGTMIIMVPSMTNLTDNVPLKEGAMQEESRPSPMT